MTLSNRIILNVVVSYGRTFISIACGIFSTRWVLMALGQESFGLYGLIAGLAVFVAFFNNQFSGALSRYYAYSIGQAQVAANQDLALNNCRNWFTTGIFIHTILPLLIVSVCYPIGGYAIRHGWLVIPPERICVCGWLWRFVCITCFVGMLNIPFSAMFVARQYIAELTVYSLVQTVTKTAFIFYMTTVERDWLFSYGLAVCLIFSIPQVLICVRAVMVFPECRFRREALKDFSRVKRLASYACWQAVGGVGYLCRHQFLEVITNRFFGPRANAVYTIGAQVGAEASALTGALTSSFTPAITTAYGAGDVISFQALAYRTCKFGLVLTLVVVIPLGLEIDEVLRLWLKSPPDSVSAFCLVWLFVIVFEKISVGHTIAVNATGNVAKYQMFHAIASMAGLLVGIGLIYFYRNIYMIGAALVLSTVLSGISDVVLARNRAGLRFRHLLSRILIPFVLPVVISFFIGILPRLFMTASFARICVTVLLVELVFLPAIWIFVFDSDERDFSRNRLHALLSRICCSRHLREGAI